MGCWNKTCAISQFPLVHGDKTVNFVVVQDGFNSQDNHPCYTTGHGWRLIPVPFYGSYNDYGWQDDDDGQQGKYDFLSEYFKDRIIKSDASTRSSGITNPFADCDSLGNAIHGNAWVLKNQLNLWDKYPATVKMGGFMISRIVWDALTAKTLVTYPKRKWYTREELAKAVDGYVAFAKEQKILADRAADNPDATTEEKLAAFRMDMSTGNFGPDMVAVEYITEKFGERTYGDPISGIIRWASSRNLNDDGMELRPVEALLSGAITSDDVAAMCLLISAMNSLRKTFQPMSHEGSQSGIDHNHKLLVKAMNDMIKLDKIRYGDY